MTSALMPATYAARVIHVIVLWRLKASALVRASNSSARRSLIFDSHAIVLDFT